MKGNCKLVLSTSVSNWTIKSDVICGRQVVEREELKMFNQLKRKVISEVEQVDKISKYFVLYLFPNIHLFYVILYMVFPIQTLSFSSLHVQCIIQKYCCFFCMKQILHCCIWMKLQVFCWICNFWWKYWEDEHWYASICEILWDQKHYWLCKAWHMK